MAAKNGEKMIFGKKKVANDCVYQVETALSSTVSKIKTFFLFMQKFKMAANMAGKRICTHVHIQ